MQNRTRRAFTAIALLLAAFLACSCNLGGALSTPEIGLGQETAAPATPEIGPGQETAAPTTPEIGPGQETPALATPVPLQSPQVATPELNWPWSLMTEPGIARAEGRFSLVAWEAVASPRFATPVPLAFEDQVPLAFSLSVYPPEALVDTEWVQRNAHDWMVEVTLRPMEERDVVDVAWASDVLIRARDYGGLPSSAAVPGPGELPVEVRQWLRPTGCVQADHPDIEAVAAQLRGDGDLMGIARRVTDFTWNLSGDEFESLDALEALHRGGSCTSRANLAAALLRANGIAARALALYPTDGNPLDTHYIVEFYVPDYGWVWIESTVGQIPWPPTAGVIVAVAYPEDEDRAAEEWLTRWTMPCSPWGSLTEDLGDANWWPEGGFEEGGDHAGSTVRLFADTARLDEAFALAQRVWQADLASKVGGRENPEAQDYGRAAAQSSTLDDLIGHLEEAARAYATE